MVEKVTEDPLERWQQLTQSWSLAVPKDISEEPRHGNGWTGPPDKDNSAVTHEQKDEHLLTFLDLTYMNEKKNTNVGVGLRAKL